jgi:putative redox protein
MPDIRIELSQTGPSTTEAAIRSHRVSVDRPEAKGGADRGAMGGELLLAGLGGCFLSNLLAAAKARETPLEDIEAAVVGTLEGTPPRFGSIRIEVSAQSSGADLEKLAAIAEKGCIVANTLKPAVAITVLVL